ncbi:MAG: MBL fold metallo-hydrolase, partial [Nitriliruptor sp.]
PAFGQMPVTEVLSDTVTRVLAPNPSPMTLDDTNTYVVGHPGRAAIVVDPGPDDADHLDRVVATAADRDVEVAAIVVTHHHVDHTEAAAALGARLGCPVHAPLQADTAHAGRVLADGDVVDVPGFEVRVVATPGHCADHVAFRLGDGALLTGDHVLGRGTSVVAHPDGDLVAYLDSLRRALAIGAHVLHPGHGPTLSEDPQAVLHFYADHREFRLKQILAAIDAGAATPAELVATIYAEVDRRLWGAAEASTRAALDHLAASGQLRTDRDGRVQRTG